MNYTDLPIPKEFEHYLPPEIPDNFLSVREYGWQKCRPRHRVHESKHYFVVHFVISGRGVFEHGGVRHELKAGDGFVIVPDELIYYEADADDPWHYAWIAFSGVNAARLLGLAGLLESGVFRARDYEALAEAFYRLTTESDKAGDPEFARIGYLYLIFSQLIKREKIDARHKDFLRLCAEYIDNNFDKSITVDGIAREFSVSRSQLFRVFNERLGVSPREYILAARLRHACLLLEQSDLTASQISLACGFSDAAHFSKIFKKRYGVPPGRYRR